MGENLLKCGYKDSKHTQLLGNLTVKRKILGSKLEQKSSKRGFSFSVFLKVR